MLINKALFKGYNSDTEDGLFILGWCKEYYYFIYSIIVNQGLQISREKRKASVFVSSSTPSILKCGEYRSFWVGWLNGTISVGRGWRYGANLILSKPETKQQPVEAVSVSSNDASSPVKWRFESDKGW